MEQSNNHDIHGDQLTLTQMENITEEVANTQPLVGAPTNVAILLTDYANTQSPGFIPGIKYLSESFSCMRKVRGDGNCFYRALLFGYLENLLNLFLSGNDQSMLAAKIEYDRIMKIIKDSLGELIALGYPDYAIESFHEELVELLESLFQQTSDSLFGMFQEGGQANYVTWFMRVLTAGALKRDAERFLPFVEGLYFDMDSYCKNEVEPMNKECEQLQIMALVEYLGISIEISYLDGRSFDATIGVPKVKIPETDNAQSTNEQKFVVHLLYRPGHYDILYI